MQDWRDKIYFHPLSIQISATIGNYSFKRRSRNQNSFPGSLVLPSNLAVLILALHAIITGESYNAGSFKTSSCSLIY